MTSYRRGGLRAIGRGATITIVVIVIIIILGGTYAALVLSKQTTTTQNSGSGPTSTSTTLPTTGGTTTTGTTNSVQNPGKLVYETSNQPSSLDPAAWSDSGSATIQFNVYETLFQYVGNQSSVVSPWLAENYTVSPNGLTYTVNLRQGIKFQDGSPFNATAVVFSFDRMILMDSNSGNVWILDGSQAPGLINGSFNYSVNFGSGGSPGHANYTQAEVNAFIASNGVVAGANPYQVIFHLGYADASFPYILGLTVASIVSPDYVIAHWTAPTDGHGYITGASGGEVDPWMKTHMSGTGPYNLSSWSQTTGDVVLTANPNYWGGPSGTGVAKIQEIDLNYVQSDSARVLDLKSGAADMADVPTSDYFAFLDQNSWLSSGQVVPTATGVATPGPFPQLNIEYIGMNFKLYTQSGTLSTFQPFQNKNFRLAMADAVNVTDILSNAASGFGVRADSPVPPGLFDYNSSVPLLYNYNLTDAAGNLTLAAKALGFSPTSPQTLTIAYGIGDSTGQAVSTELSTNINNLGLGITIQVAPVPFNQLLAGVVARTYPMFVLQYLADYPETTDFLQAFGSASANVGYFVGYNNTNVVNLINQQAATTNPTTRAELINQAEVAMNQDVPYIWLYYPSVFGYTGQMMRTWIHGFQFNAAYSGPYFYELSKG